MCEFSILATSESLRLQALLASAVLGRLAVAAAAVVAAFAVVASYAVVA